MTEEGRNQSSLSPKASDATSGVPFKKEDGSVEAAISSAYGTA